jgi:uncharacterized protein
MYPQFGLVLMVSHACNLRCSYCYTGRKFSRTMSERIGRTAIDRAIASVAPGGRLELGFFGGEPLLEAGLIAGLMAHARERTAREGKTLSIQLTTNGTLIGPEAWSLMMLPDLQLAVSFDGLPSVHDRHRLLPHGGGTSKQVLELIARLVSAGKEFRVSMVVRPDTAVVLPEGIEYLLRLGVRQIEPTLDLWACWTIEEIALLKQAVARSARIWRDHLPDVSIGWFDEKAAVLAGVPATPTARCGFGRGELAVAPSGRLYPCERLIGEDRPDQPLQLPGHALEGEDFLDISGAPGRSHPACDVCTMLGTCNTICRCSNYVRTGDVSRPDRLLCVWNQACLDEVARVFAEGNPCAVSASSTADQD